jgi:hypothetical protein
MLHTALVRGAPDNVTIISVQCSDTDARNTDVSGIYPVD